MKLSYRTRSRYGQGKDIFPKKSVIITNPAFSAWNASDLSVDIVYLVVSFVLIAFRFIYIYLTALGESALQHT